MLGTLLVLFLMSSYGKEMVEAICCCDMMVGDVNPFSNFIGHYLLAQLSSLLMDISFSLSHFSLLLLFNKKNCFDDRYFLSST